MLLGVSVLPDFQILPQFSNPPNICGASCVYLHFDTLLSLTIKLRNSMLLTLNKVMILLCKFGLLLTAYAKVPNAMPRGDFFISLCKCGRCPAAIL